MLKERDAAVLQQEIGEAASISFPLLPEPDWLAYFKAFCAAHGQWPVHYKGRLLFSDGWQYSASDLAGPEWPPPEDKKNLRRLRIVYYRRRREIIMEEIKAVEQVIDLMTRAQAACSLPIKTVWYDREAGRHVSKDLDLLPAMERLDWLRKDHAECEQAILSLRGIDDD